MDDQQRSHPLDLDVSSGELDLFAEELPAAQRHEMPPNSFSTLGCECELSTFFCYGCGADLTAEQRAQVDAPEGFEDALKWAREKLNTSPDEDPAAEVLQTVFRAARRKQG
jgi:hypothetical protein